jgi:hypothetical protein
MIEAAEETMRRRQEPVLVAEMVLAGLAGRVAKRLQQLGDRLVLRLEADRGAGQPGLGEAGAEDALPGDERGTARRTGLLAVGVGEHRPIPGDAVGVRRAVAHHAVAVTA